MCPKVTIICISARAPSQSFLMPRVVPRSRAELEPQDVLKFKFQRYKDRLSAAQKETAEKDAPVVMKGTLKGTGLSPVRSSSPSWGSMASWSVPASWRR